MLGNVLSITLKCLTSNITRGIASQISSILSKKTTNYLSEIVFKANDEEAFSFIITFTTFLLKKRSCDVKED